MPAPTFDPASYTAAIVENSAPGAALGTVVATDPDGASVTYVIVAGNEDKFYAVDAATGAVTTAQSLDFETTTGSTLTIAATDPGGEFGTATLAVAVTDVDEAPVAGAPAQFSVAENSVAGTAVGTVAAIDPEGAALTYSLTTQGAPFAVDASTGAITTTAPLDREQLASYTLDLSASDGTNSTPFAANVAVTDVNEAPVNATTGDFSAIEGQAAGTAVGTVAAIDPEGAALAYVIASGNDDNAFAVDAATGQVTTTAGFGYGDATSRALGIAASDGTNSLAIPVTVAIENVPDAPVFTAAQASVREDAAAGANLGRFAVADAGNNAVVFSGPVGQGYAVAADGAVTLTGPLDFETARTLAVSATAAFAGASGPAARSPAGSGTVAVTDLDEAPVAGSGSSFSVAENLPAGTVVGTVAAADPESRPVGYTLITNGVPFRVNAVTGQITTTAPLDREAAASYTLAVGATDGTNTTPLSVAVTIKDADEAPVSGAVAPLSVAENLPAGTLVGAVSATDPEGTAVAYALATQNVPFAVDAATGRIATTAPLDREEFASYTLAIDATDATGQSTPISVPVSITNVDEAPVPGAVAPLSLAEDLAVGTAVGAVSATDPEGAAVAYALATQNVPFAVDTATGRIATTAPLDYEAARSYTLAVSAADATGQSTPISVPVSITNVDEAPVPNGTGPFSVAENLPAGTVVGSVSANNPEGTAVGYTLTTQGAPFAVNAITGRITTTAPLDREAVTSYALEVDATDGSTTTSISVPISVTNVDEVPTPGAAATATLAESVAAGTVVGTVSATDPEGAPLTYAMARPGVPFAVDASTGAITTTAPLDFETRASYSLALSASDGASTVPLSASFVVTDVDEAPVAVGQLGPFSVAENSGAGVTVGRVSATDPEGAAVTYTLATPGVPFVADASTGAITTTAPLDREVASSYTLAVNATDATGNTAPVGVLVNVTDVDEAPTAGAPAQFTISENLAAGAAVGTVVVTDPEGAALTYALTTQDVPFAVDAATGAITTTAALDFEQLQSAVFNLALAASDGTSTVPLAASVTVRDVNEAPVAPGPFGAFSAIEGQTAGTAVGTVLATDPEGRALTYAITAGNDDGAFAIAATGTGADAPGLITTTTAFGYGAETARALTIAATDGVNALTIPVRVTIENVPDAPIFAAAEVSVSEDAAAGTVLGRFSAASAGGNGVTFAGPSGAGYTVAADGAVTLTAALDYETARTLVVSATAAFADASGPAARSPAGLGTVNVADVYEAGTPGQSVPPAPVTVDGGVAIIGGTSADFKAVAGELAFTEDGGAVTLVPGVERAVFADGTLSFAAGTPEAFLQRLYLGLLGREADGRGIAYQADRLEGGATPGQVAQGFAESPEYIGNANGVPSDRAFVESLYVNFLGRQADEGGVNFWTGQLAASTASRGDVAAGFANSSEAQAKYNAATSRGVWVADFEDLDLDALYVAGLGREADPAARTAASAALEAGTLTREGLAEAIAGSAEYAARHGSDAGTAVNVIFRDALGRDADPGALAAFVPVYTAQGQGPAAVLLAVTASTEFATVENYRASGEYLFS